MIIDSHIYLFTPIDSPEGPNKSTQRIRWAQSSYSGHHQPAWRIKDHQVSDSSAIGPKTQKDIDDLPDVNFRADHDYGRIVWTIDGEDYTKQFFPPNLKNMEYTPYSAISEMDYAGIDMALIHTDPMLVRDVDFLSSCVTEFPNRFRTMVPVDEWDVEHNCDKILEKLVYSISELNLHAIKFHTSLVKNELKKDWSSGPLKYFWDTATSLGVPIFFTLGTGYANSTDTISVQQSGYQSELKILCDWMEKYPDNVCSLTHGFPWRIFIEDDQIKLPDWIWTPFSGKNCNIEVCLPVRIGDIFEYPYKVAWDPLKQMVNKIGSSNLLWGTDMPFQNRFCTYTQSRTWIENHCDFLDDKDTSMIMGGTAQRILKI